MWFIDEGPLVFFNLRPLPEILNMANLHTLQAGFQPVQNLTLDFTE